MGALVNKTGKQSYFYIGSVVIVSNYIAITAAHTVRLMDVRFTNHPPSSMYIILCFRKGRTPKVMLSSGETATIYRVLLVSTTGFVHSRPMVTSTSSVSLITTSLSSVSSSLLAKKERRLYILLTGNTRSVQSVSLTDFQSKYLFSINPQPELKYVDGESLWKRVPPRNR